MIHDLDDTTRSRRLLYAAATAIMLAFPAASATGETFRYDSTTVDTAAHWASRATLANALMFSGLGEPVSVLMTERDVILKHAGYIVRPPMPDMAMVGAVYAAGDPSFVAAPDLADLRTLQWNAASFNRDLHPEAQAWALIKVTAPEFHLNYHESRDEKRVALMMLPQARILADTLAKRLRNTDGLFATLSPEGRFAEPQPRQQVAVLWAASSLVLAATSEREDYWHDAAREILDPNAGRALADAALAAVEALPPETPAEQALAIAAFGRYAIASDDGNERGRALQLARNHADRLTALPPGVGLEGLGLAVYGLTEAARFLGDDTYGEAAVELFQSRLLPLWDEEIGAFRASDGETAYTPRTLAALAAALNALRWHGSDSAAAEADRLYPQLFETVLVQAGMLQASPLPLVSQDYLDRVPAAHFAHPELPLPGDAGRAPVFAAEIRFADGAWSVTDRTFRTVDAMLLANMLVMERDGRSDAFLPADRLAGLEH